MKIFRFVQISFELYAPSIGWSATASVSANWLALEVPLISLLWESFRSLGPLVYEIYDFEILIFFEILNISRCGLVGGNEGQASITTSM